MRIKLIKRVILEKDEEDSFDDHILPVGTLATVLSDDIVDYWVLLDDKTFIDEYAYIPKDHAEVISE